MKVIDVYRRTDRQTDNDEHRRQKRRRGRDRGSDKDRRSEHRGRAADLQKAFELRLNGCLVSLISLISRRASSSACCSY